MYFAKVKRVILLVLLIFSGTVRAGWFDFALGTIRHVWLTPIIWSSYQAHRNTIQSHVYVRSRFDPLLKSKCPTAYAYIQAELSNVGIDPATIMILNAQDSRSKAWIYARSIEVPVQKLEDVLQSMQQKQNPAVMRRLMYRLAKIKFLIVHEIGHLTEYIGITKHVPVLALGAAGICFVSHYVPQLRNPVFAILGTFVGAVAKYWLAHGVDSVYDIVQEYNADTVFINRFKDNPEILFSVAQSFLWYHSKRLFACAARSPQKNKFRNLCSPILLSIDSIKGDDRHPSDLARASRFFAAAGKPVTQQALADELLKQAEFIQTPFGKRLFQLIDWWNLDVYRALRKNQPHEHTARWLADCAETISEIPEDQTKQACKLLAPFIERLPEYTLLPELDCLRTQIIQNYEINCQRLKRS